MRRVAGQGEGRWRSRGVALALGSALWLASAAAWADADAALREGAVARDRARETGRMSDWQLAYDQFARAVAEQESVAARFELAEAASALGQLDVAYESYELALAQGLSGKAESVAREFVAAHAGDVARVELTAPAGTTVFVNGNRRAQLPLARPLVVPVGRVRLRLMAPHAEPWEQAIDADAQVVMRLAPELVRLDQPAAAPALAQPVDEPSWLGQHPLAIGLMGVAGVALIGGGYATFAHFDRQGKADDAREQILGALQRNVDEGVIGAGSVPCGPIGIASGNVTFDSGVPDSTRQRLLSDYANACSEFDKRTDSAKNLRNLAFVGLGVGAASLGALLTWYFVDTAGEQDGGADRARAPRLTPLLSGDTQGLLLELSF